MSHSSDEKDEIEAEAEVLSVEVLQDKANEHLVAIKRCFPTEPKTGDHNYVDWCVYKVIEFLVTLVSDVENTTVLLYKKLEQFQQSLPAVPSKKRTHSELVVNEYMEKLKACTLYTKRTDYLYNVRILLHELLVQLDKHEKTTKSMIESCQVPPVEISIDNNKLMSSDDNMQQSNFNVAVLHTTLQNLQDENKENNNKQLDDTEIKFKQHALFHIEKVLAQTDKTHDEKGPVPRRGNKHHVIKQRDAYKLCNQVWKYRELNKDESDAFSIRLKDFFQKEITELYSRAKEYEEDFFNNKEKYVGDYLKNKENKKPTK